jgi:hypothetical protein
MFEIALLLMGWLAVGMGLIAFRCLHVAQPVDHRTDAHF